jgi:hypothetical protein
MLHKGYRMDWVLFKYRGIYIRFLKAGESRLMAPQMGKEFFFGQELGNLSSYQDFLRCLACLSDLVTRDRQ